MKALMRRQIGANERFRRLPVARRPADRETRRGGRVAARSRPRPLRCRAAARGCARRPRDQRGDGLRARSQTDGLEPARALAARLAEDLEREPDVSSAEAAGPGFINIILKPEVYERVVKTVLMQGAALRGRRAERGRACQRRICEREPDRADARRSRPRRGVRRCAREPPDIFRSRSDAGILRQRRRRSGRRPGALGFSSLPRGLGRGRRSDARRPLPRRLPEIGRRGPGARVWRGAQGQARDGVAAERRGNAQQMR